MKHASLLLINVERRFELAGDGVDASLLLTV